MHLIGRQGSMARVCVLALGALMGATSVGMAGTEQPAAPRFGSFGIDLAALDPAIKPGNDFFRYVDGRWLATEKIPADRTSWGSFAILREQADSDVKAIIETAAAADVPKGTNEQKIGDFYKAFLDTDKIDQLGLAPAKASLAAIAGIKTHEQAAALIATPGMPLDGPIGYGISLDEKNPDRYIVEIGQSGLSLPDREYYLKA